MEEGWRFAVEGYIEKLSTNTIILEGGPAFNADMTIGMLVGDRLYWASILGA